MLINRVEIEEENKIINKYSTLVLSNIKKYYVNLHNFAY